MKTLILSPLYPPDTAPSAEYVKELAGRLADHDVTVMLLGHLPEAVPDVTYACIDKRTSNLRRSISWIKHLVSVIGQYDLIIIQNGPPIELPSLIAFWFGGAPTILIESDEPALKRTLEHPVLRFIHQRLQRRTIATLSKETHPWPPLRPKVHPLKPFPTDDMRHYETAWQAHLKKLKSILSTNHV